MPQRKFDVTLFAKSGEADRNSDGFDFNDVDILILEDQRCAVFEKRTATICPKSCKNPFCSI
jgi:hypothetical protein